MVLLDDHVTDLSAKRQRINCNSHQFISRIAAVFGLHTNAVIFVDMADGIHGRETFVGSIGGVVSLEEVVREVVRDVGREMVREMVKEVIREVVREMDREMVREVVRELVRERVREVIREVVKEVVREMVREVFR